MLPCRGPIAAVATLASKSRIAPIFVAGCLAWFGPYFKRMSKTPEFSPAHIDDIIQMALSDHVSFQDIRREYGILEKDVKALMRDNLKSGSYRAWRKRVRDFGDRREVYK